MSTNSAPTRAPSRRERLREELTREIVEIGRAQLASGGPAAISWRGIAQEVGMNPASLYTYIDGVDDLVTRILETSFNDLAEHVGRVAADHADADAATRLLACCRAYRDWAVEHPQQFNLIFTDQIPGYAAPPGGVTVAAETAVFRPMVEAVGALTGQALDPLALTDLPLPERTRVYAPFAALHGFVMLEINHHAPAGSYEAMLMLHLESVIESLRR